MKTLIKTLKKQSKQIKKGFQSIPRVPDQYLHVFYCEALFHNPQTDEEELVELWKIKIDKRKFKTSELRQSIAAGIIYCFLETPEAQKRGINRIFFWNNGSGKYEPLGAVSDTSFNTEDAESVKIEADPVKAYERLKGLCVEIEVTRMDLS